MSTRTPLPTLDLDDLLRCLPLSSARGRKRRGRGRGALNDEFPDPLYRAPGQALYPERYDEAALEVRRTRPREWAALYQQDPRTEGGSLIDRDLYMTRDPRRTRKLAPDEFDRRTEGLLWVRGWDFAYSEKEWNKEDPDWTVGILMAFLVDMDQLTWDVYVKDMRRFQKLWNATKVTVRDVALHEDGPSVWVSGECNGPQKAAWNDVQNMVSLAAHFKVGAPLAEMYGPRSDKSARAQIWYDKAQEGRIWIRDGAWNGPWLDELEAFPNGSHDDIVDAMSVAYAACAMRSSGAGQEPTIERDNVQFYED